MREQEKAQMIARLDGVTQHLCALCKLVENEAPQLNFIKRSGASDWWVEHKNHDDKIRRGLYP